MSLYRKLPKVDGLLTHPDLAKLPHSVAVTAIRQVLEGLRDEIADGTLSELPEIVPLVTSVAELLMEGKMRRVLNATGVVVHTNLGRAPWSPTAIRAATEVARGYCNLEMDLETGKRGGRLDGLAALMRHLTGCEAALVVNNCAAAVMLSLTALADDQEVVVSRGELVEIGGSYRVPDVIQAGGARLVEVGTTNRTRIADYAAVVNEETGVLLKVHRSNFRIVGFTEETSLEELVELGEEKGIAVIQDLGSGAIRSVCGEPTVADSVQAGVDVVLFSGDKLLGGPQAGIAVGRKEVIERMRKHPMYRALRVDKVILAGLEATLALYATGGAPPVVQMVEETTVQLSNRADALLQALRDVEIPGERRAVQGYVGGGAIPETQIASEAVVLQPANIERFTSALRSGKPAVVGRVSEGEFWMDVRTIVEDEIPILANCVSQCWESAKGSP